MKSFKIVLLSAVCSSFLFASSSSDLFDQVVKTVQTQSTSSTSESSNINFSKFDKEVSSLLEKLQSAKTPAEQNKIQEQAKKYYESFVKGMNSEEKTQVLNHVQNLLVENQDEIKKLIIENQDAIKALSPKLKEGLKSFQK